jgi:demethylmenaquinone methyltransferase/2-methoxy-6-polyprenyl-1,4-benzoquinol methylase
MDRRILEEQIAFYRARAPEYDQSWATLQELERDLFRWEPDRQYDLLFAGFWLSHVPPDLMDDFLVKVHRAVRPCGTVFFVDQCNDIRDDVQGDTDGILQKRRTADGRTFTIVKVYYHPALLAGRLNGFGFDAAGRRIGEAFFTIIGRKR